MKLALPLSETVEIPLYDDKNLAEDLKIVGRNQLAEKITGGLSWPSKMPGPAWGISAYRCEIGGVLAGKEGSICSAEVCYAKRGRYRFENVQDKLEERYQGLADPLWTPSMILLISWYADTYFRLFDSGDVQGLNHMKNICTVAKHVPTVRFWMPTKEAAVVRACRDDIPPNLVVRLSAPMIDAKPPKNWPTTSTVFSDEPQEGSFPCPAKKNGNRCGTCRSCWTPSVKDVGYPLR